MFSVIIALLQSYTVCEYCLPVEQPTFGMDGLYMNTPVQHRLREGRQGAERDPGGQEDEPFAAAGSK